jgi:hypothetical protein
VQRRYVLEVETDPQGKRSPGDLQDLLEVVDGLREGEGDHRARRRRFGPLQGAAKQLVRPQAPGRQASAAGLGDDLHLDTAQLL